MSMTQVLEAQSDSKLDKKTQEGMDTLSKEYSNIVLLKKRRYRIKFRVVVGQTLLGNKIKFQQGRQEKSHKHKSRKYHSK